MDMVDKCGGKEKGRLDGECVGMMLSRPWSPWPLHVIYINYTYRKPTTSSVVTFVLFLSLKNVTMQPSPTAKVRSKSILQTNGTFWSVLSKSAHLAFPGPAANVLLRLRPVPSAANPSPITGLRTCETDRSTGGVFRRQSCEASWRAGAGHVRLEGMG